MDVPPTANGSRPAGSVPCQAGLADQSRIPPRQSTQERPAAEASYASPSAGMALSRRVKSVTTAFSTARTEAALPSAASGLAAAMARSMVQRNATTALTMALTLANTVARWLVPGATSAVTALPTEISARSAILESRTVNHSKAATRTAGTSCCRQNAQKNETRRRSPHHTPRDRPHSKGRANRNLCWIEVAAAVASWLA